MKSSLLQETFELIKSLTKAEKRYFTMFTKFQSGDKTYLKLFDIIDKQPTFNEQTIDQKFLSAVNTKNYPSVKKYLFDQLILSLKSYGAYKDLDSDHTDLIETYKVLHYKGLVGQAGKLLKKVKEVTLADDAFIRHYYIQLFEYKEELYSPEDSSSSRIRQLFEERKRILKIIYNYSWVGDIFSLQRIYLRKKLYCRNQAEKDELTRRIKPLLKTSETDMLSRTALGLRNMALCDYYVAIGQPAKAFKTSRIYLELRKNAGSLDKVETQTISEYGNHLWLCVRTGYFDEFEKHWNDFKSFMKNIRNWDKTVLSYERWISYGLIYFVRTGQFEKAIELMEDEKKNINLYQKTFGMKTKLSLWYFNALCYYALRDHKNALKLIQKIIQAGDSEAEEYNFSKLLMMFIHYDLGNFELLEYQVRSTQRFMEKKERLYQCERLVLDFFKTIAVVDSKKLRRQQLEQLQKKVIALFRTPFERGFIFYFDIEAWIESQLKGKRFAEMVKSSVS